MGSFGSPAPSVPLSSVLQETAWTPPLQPAGTAGGAAAPPRPTVGPAGAAGGNQLSAPPRPTAGPTHARTSPGHPSLLPSSGVSSPVSAPPLHRPVMATTPPTTAEAGGDSSLRAQPGAGEHTNPQTKLLPVLAIATLLPRQPPLETAAAKQEPDEQQQQPDPDKTTISTLQTTSLVTILIAESQETFNHNHENSTSPSIIFEGKIRWSTKKKEKEKRGDQSIVN
ncbi:PREDICTED: formin-like protein 3 [Pseudopodoces humilis]|uniref:formin-like protein 3 n=1 Tax=Pseudopodoces humilis TaxID=181119 RepID=UPI0006B7FB6A|nr:PREDICTED: formin-like protein 3 [Pseudopodoces humilis]